MSRFKRLLSVLLIMTLVCTGLHVVPKEVEAADNVVQTQITGVNQSTDYTCGFENKDPSSYHYYLWLGHSNSSIRSSLAWSSSGISSESSTFQVLLNGVEINARLRIDNNSMALVLREGLDSRISGLLGTPGSENATGVTITVKKGTQVTHTANSNVLEFTESFTYYTADGLTWNCITESKKINFTSVANYEPSNYIQLYMDISDMSTESGFFFSVPVSIEKNGVKTEYTATPRGYGANNRMRFVISDLPAVETGLTIRIAAGTEFYHTNGGGGYKNSFYTPYELETEFVSYYDGSSWVVGEYDPTIDTEMTGFETEEHVSSGAVDGINFHLKTDILLCGDGSEYGFTANTTYFCSDEAESNKNFTIQVDGIDKTVQLRASAKGGFWFTLLGAHEPRNGMTISLQEGTMLYSGGYAFELTNSFHVRFDGSQWIQITEEEAAKIPITLSANTSTGVNDRDTQIDVYIDADVNFQSTYGISSGTYFGGSARPNAVYINGVEHKYNIIAMGYYTFRVLWTDNLSREVGTTFVIPKGTLLTAGDYTFEVRESYGLKYDGTNWNNYKIYDDAVSLTITGAAYGTAKDCVNVKVSEDLTSYGVEVGTKLTSAITGVTSVEVVASDTLSFQLAEESESFTIAADTELVAEEADKAFKTANAFTVNYDGYQWLQEGSDTIDYHTITISGIRSDSAEDSTTGEITTGQWVYLNTTANEETNAAVMGNSYNFSADGISYTGAEAPNRIFIDTKSGALYLKYSATELDTISFPAGTVLNETNGNNTAIVIADAFTMHFYQDHWIIDNEGPSILYNGTELSEEEEIIVYAGYTNALQDKFTALDALTGSCAIVMEGFPTSFQEDTTYDISLKAEDLFGNASTRNVKISVQPNNVVNFHEDDVAMDVRDLIALKKYINDTTNEYDDWYDLKGDGVLDGEDAARMRKVLVGLYETVEGSAIMPVYDETLSVNIFANWPADQTDETARDTYFAAGFTDLLMTEDYNAKLDSNSDGIIDTAYSSAIEAVQKAGNNVIIRNYPGTTDYLSSSLAEQIAKLNVSGIYYWDEPASSDLTSLVALAQQHEQYNSDSMFWTTLLPSHGFSSATEYDNYLDTYVSSVLGEVETGRKVLAMDNYPLLYGQILGLFDTTKENYYTIRESYLTNLYELSSRALTYNQGKSEEESAMEVGAYIQVYTEDDQRVRKITATSDVTYQTNVSLAMGVNNLGYFMYSNHGDSTMSGLVDNSGAIVNQTAYDAVQTANTQILQWDHILKSYEWQGVKTYKATSGSTTRETTTGEAIDALTSIYTAPEFAWLESASATEDSLISEFADEVNGYYGYMAVNFSEPTLGRTSEVTMQFDTGVSKVVVYTNGVRSVQSVSNGAYEVQIPAGGAVFVIPCI